MKTVKNTKSKRYMYIRLACFIAVFTAGAAVMFTDIYIGESERGSIGEYIAVLAVLSCWAYYIPAIVKRLGKSYTKNGRKSELRILRKIFVMIGSVRPVDNMRILSAMHDKAVYYKQDIENIMEVLRKSGIDREDFFSELLSRTKDIDAKLFYEKLSIGFMYDFDLAVRSIESDVIQERREYARDIKKRIKLINIIGTACLFAAMTLLLIYMLRPWLDSMGLSI